ncbi:helix-turn-helix domain-containing protein [Aquimarina macrocephali]|uniref:helix-turn-helix domain-containing protein n=1 Tax=Aquimarina macrocephali TaxID=666563 RepID=UPI0004675CE9|nr:AraC family transcriptional regulator [Aquimarina macrocephali]
MKAIYSFVVLGCFMSTLYSMQEIKAEQNTFKDSLQNKTLRELATAFWNVKDLDSVYKRKLADTYIFKAKKQINNERIADGYQMFLSIYEKQPEISLQYADSIIEITKKLQNNHYPSTGYMIKGNILSTIEQHDAALEAYLVAKEYAERNNNKRQLIGLKHNIALLKTILGKEKEALLVYKENYSYLLKQDSVIKRSQIYIATLYKLSDSYNRLKYYDSAYFYLKKGIKASLSSTYKHYYPNLLFAYGINSYYREEYQSAIDSLDKALILSEEDVNDVNVRKGYLYLAKTYLQLKEEQKALQYLKKVDEITNESNYRLEIGETFTLLLDHYKKNKDQRNQLEIMKKLLRYENASNIKYSRLNHSIVKKYDIPQLIKDKDHLISEIRNDNKVLTYKSIAFSVFLIIIVSSLYIYFSKKRKNKYKVQLNKELEKVKVLENKEGKIVKSSKDFSAKLKKEILEKLNDFEYNKEYLKNDLTLNKVSKNLKTNSTYLSKVINMEKKKNFANYINDLRIEYCIQQIEQNKNFKHYSIRSMAKEVGFNNLQSFVTAFSKQKGCNPAEFMKRYVS